MSISFTSSPARSPCPPAQSQQPVPETISKSPFVAVLAEFALRLVSSRRVRSFATYAASSSRLTTSSADPGLPIAGGDYDRRHAVGSCGLLGRLALARNDKDPNTRYALDHATGLQPQHRITHHRDRNLVLLAELNRTRQPITRL